jgi:hypothetical protein
MFASRSVLYDTNLAGSAERTTRERILEFFHPSMGDSSYRSSPKGDTRFVRVCFDCHRFMGRRCRRAKVRRRHNLSSTDTRGHWGTRAHR